MLLCAPPPPSTPSHPPTHTRTDKLQSHLVVKPYACSTCGYASTAVSAVRRHINTSHPDQPAEVIATKPNSSLQHARRGGSGGAPRGQHHGQGMEDDDEAGEEQDLDSEAEMAAVEEAERKGRGERGGAPLDPMAPAKPMVVINDLAHFQCRYCEYQTRHRHHLKSHEAVGGGVIIIFSLSDLASQEHAVSLCIRKGWGQVQRKGWVLFPARCVASEARAWGCS
jgi:hypothetical protein